MAAENKFDKLRSMVHQGVPIEKTASEEVKSIDTATEVEMITVEKTEPEVKLE